MDSSIASIIVAIFAFLGTIFGSYIANKKSQALIAYRLQELENKVNKHNCLVERTYKLEEHEAVIDEQIKAVNQRISDLERGS